MQTTNIQPTQQSILKSAISIIQKRGIQDLTVRNVCQEAGCSTGAFYHYFAGKEELLTFIIGDRHSQFANSDKSSWKELQPIEYLLEDMVDISQYFSSLGVDFVQEYFSPKNKSLDISYLNTLKGSRGVVNDLIAALTNAYMGGLFQEQKQKDFSFIEMLYRELNSIFYGCVFGWAVSNGSYDLSKEMRKMLSLHLNCYLKQEYQIGI